MPNIREYSAPSGKINPDEKGYAAYETAGRRIGPLYNQAAQDVEKGGKLQDQLISQLERETDEHMPQVLRGKGGSGGGGIGGGGISSPRGSGGGGGYRPQSSGFDNFVDPLDAANAAKWAASTARKLTGSPGNGLGGSLDELQWQQSHDGLTQDQQQRLQMLSDIQTQKDNTRMNMAIQQQLNKEIAARDASTAEWYKNLSERQNIGPNDVRDAGAREFNADVFLGSKNPQLPKDAAQSFDYITGRSSAAGEALSAGWQNLSNNAEFIGSNVANGASLTASDAANGAKLFSEDLSSPDPSGPQWSVPNSPGEAPSLTNFTTNFTGDQ